MAAGRGQVVIGDREAGEGDQGLQAHLARGADAEGATMPALMNPGVTWPRGAVSRAAPSSEGISAAILEIGACIRKLGAPWAPGR